MPGYRGDCPELAKFSTAYSESGDAVRSAAESLTGVRRASTSDGPKLTVALPTSAVRQVQSGTVMVD